MPQARTGDRGASIPWDGSWHALLPSWLLSHLLHWDGERTGSGGAWAGGHTCGNGREAKPRTRCPNLLLGLRLGFVTGEGSLTTPLQTKTIFMSRT